MTAIIICGMLGVLLASYFGPGLLAMGYRGLLHRLRRSPPIADCDVHFPYARRLEAEWHAIRAEFDACRAGLAPLPSLHEIDPLQKRVATHGGIAWPVQILKIYGQDALEAAARFPLVSRLLAGEPRIITAMFSILSPGKVIPTHKGLFPGVWRYHLCLRAPRCGSSHLLVGTNVHHWKEGGSVLFDDTGPHSAHNPTEEERVVLFLDIIRIDTPRILQVLDAGWLRLARTSWRFRGALRRVNDLAGHAAQSEPNS